MIRSLSVARRLRAVTSGLALATALAAQPALAQSYDGTPTVVSGGVTIDRVSVPNSDIVTVTTPTAVIDWAPNSRTGTGVIDFQAAGTTATYQNAPGGGDFTVLNRIVPVDPTRAIAFNGRVVSQLRDTAGNVARGGSVWFYSPGGIVIGDGAVFDIGNLLLTTADPTGGSGTIGSTTRFSLASTAGGNGIVNILSNATINATNPGSYVALVAPIVFQAGTVNTNGAAAYVAAEQANLTFDQGLFDINVTVGSSAAGGFPMQHRGTTRFVDAAGQRRAYLVAVPKNDAITLVVESSGTLGFDVATAANIQNGTIFLSAGPTRVNEAQNLFSGASPVVANLAVQAGAFNAPVRATAFDAASVRSTAALSFASDVAVLAGTGIDAGASRAGETLRFGGNVNMTVNPIALGRAAGGGATLSSLNTGTTQVAGNLVLQSFGDVAGAGSVTAGNTSLLAEGGNMSIGGSLFMRSIATASQSAAPGLDNGNATAGTTRVSVGAAYGLTVGTTATLSATATGGTNTGAGDNVAGSGQGGTVQLASAGTLAIGGATSLSAAGAGGVQSTGGTGGTGTAGIAEVAITGGTAQFSGGLTVAAVGTGGGGGGAGTGGTARVLTGAAGAAVTVTGLTSIDAGGLGGGTLAGSSGGAATGGTALLQLAATTGTGTTSVSVGGLTVNGAGFGGAGGTTATASGGAGTGGAARIETGARTALTAGTTLVRADAFGGATAGGAAGSATGGAASATANGSATFASLNINSAVVAGSRAGGTGAAGAGRAGTTLAQAAGAGVLTVNTALTLNSQGNGGNVTAGSGAGGAGTGADSRIVASGGGRITAGSVAVFAGAVGGNGGGVGAGGAATASTASISQGTGGTITVTTTALGGANAIGGAGAGAGVGGSALGGDVRIAANDGLIAIGGSATLGAGGTGGAGAIGGTGIGGVTNLGVTTGEARIGGAVLLTSNGTGGASAAGNGAEGRGGTALFGTVGAGGTIAAPSSVSLQAIGTGGATALAGGTGGAGIGGTAQLFSTASVTVGGANVNAQAAGGGFSANGGTGGAATGGLALIRANGGTLAATSLATVAVGRGGSGGTGVTGNGGAGAGGHARIDTISAATAGTITTPVVIVNANGIGGNAGGAGGNGGEGRGGNDPATFTAGAYLVAQGGSVTVTQQASVSATGTGGIGFGAGTGGTGRGGYANAVSFNGTLDVSAATSFITNALGQGGAATAVRDASGTVVSGGGAGGVGVGGQAVLSAGTTAAAAGAIGRTLVGGAEDGTSFVNVNARGFGGAGGDGAAGRDGGIGGTGNAGRIDILAQAGNGVLVAGTVQGLVTGFGGAGGAGGVADAAGVSGNGGAGGTGTGGVGNAGTASGPPSTFNAGSATFGTLRVSSNGFGGAGGSAQAGSGGIGGAAISRGFAVLARGTPVSAGTISILTVAEGGLGGTNAAGVTAAAGSGSASNARLFVTNRDSRSERGTLNADTVSLIAGGEVFRQGPATVAGSAQIILNNGDATIGTLTMNAVSPVAGADRTGLSITGGTLSVTGSTMIDALGDVFLFTGPGGAIGLGETTIRTTGGLDFGSAMAPSRTPGALTLNGGVTLSLGDLTLDGPLAVGGTLSATSAGGIAVRDVTAGGDLLLFADAGIATGALGAGSSIGVYAEGPVTTGTITAAQSATAGMGYVEVASRAGAITVGDVSGVSIEIEQSDDPAEGPFDAVRTGTLRAETVGVNVMGDLAVAAVDGGDFYAGLSDEAGFLVGLGSGGGSVTVGSVGALGAIGLGAATDLNAGPVTTPESLLVLAGGNVRLGAITSGAAGTTFISNASILRSDPAFAGFEDFGDFDAEFDPATLATLTPVRVGGAITLAGPVTAGRFVAAAAGPIEAGAITAAGAIELDGGAAVTTGALDGASLFVDAAGPLAIGAATGREGPVGLLSTGALDVGPVVSAGFIGLAARGGDVRAGTITGGGSVALLAGGSVTAGAVTTGRGVDDVLYIANATLLATPPFAGLGRTPPVGLARLAPTRVAGTVTLTGTASAPNLVVAANGAITTGGLDVTGRIALDGGAAVGIGDVDTPAELAVSAAGGITAGRLAANGVSLTSGAGSVTSGAITSRRGIVLAGAAGVTTGDLLALNRISVNSGAGIAAGTVESTGGGVAMTAGGTLGLGNVRAAGSIALTATATIRTGDLTAGTGPLVPDGETRGEGGGVLAGGSGLAVPGGIAPGFDAAAIVRCDDCATGAQQLGFAANFFGNTYTTTYVSNNGYLTFNSGQSSFTPEGLGTGYTGQPILAAFFADVDTTNPLSAQATYGTGTYGGRPAFGATWNGVGYYDGKADRLNAFQIVMADRGDTGAGNFDIYYNYGRIRWETGDVDGGSGGLGGMSAAVGFNAGTGNQPGTFLELPGSLRPGSFIDGGSTPLASIGNGGAVGQLVYTVRNGMIVAPAGEAATIRVSNTGAPAGTTPSITTGRLTAEAVDVRGAGDVTMAGINVLDLGRGGGRGADPFATLVQAAGALTVGAVDGSGAITLDGGTGPLSTGAVSGAGAIAITADRGAITTGAIAGRAGVLIDADGGAVTTAGVTAATTARIEASGLIALDGAVTAPVVELVSADLAIRTNGLAAAGDTLSIIALSTQAPAILGGSGEAAGAGYRLDAGEIARLRGGNIAFVQQGRPAGDAQLILRDLTLTGSAAPQGTAANLTSAGGTVTITTGGSIRVTGEVRLANAAAGDTLSFVAGESFDLVTDAGGVAVTGTGDALGGRLAIRATDISVADAALFARSAATDFDAVNAAEVIAAIGAPAARTRPEGALRAGRIELAATDFIAIQNSGTADTAAGFAAGAGGIAFTSAAPAGNPLALVAYGRVQGADGGFIVNAATRDAVTFASGGEQGGRLSGFDPRSVINGCGIVAVTCGGDGGSVPVAETREVVAIGPNLQGILAATLSGVADATEATALPVVRLTPVIDTAVMTTQSIITEPVAGGGNPSLWGDEQGDDEEEDRDGRPVATREGGRP